MGATDKAVGLVDRFAACFSDGRDGELIEHTVPTLTGQRLIAIALGYGDLNDECLRHFEVDHKLILCGPLNGKLARVAPERIRST